MLRKMIQRKAREEQGMTMVVAIMVVVIMTSFMLTMTTLAIMAMQTSIATRDAAYFDIAVSTATSNALNLANNPTKNGLGQVTDSVANHLESNPQTGVLDNETNTKWRWYAVPVTSSFSGLSYDIVATGYRDDPQDVTTSRTVTVRMVSFPTSGARKIDDSIYYRPTQNSIFSWGVFGSSSVAVSGTTTISSFNSLDNSFAENVSLGSNETINVSPTATVPKISVMNTYPGHTTNERCTGDVCQPSIVTEYTYGVDTTVIQEWINQACPLDAALYPSVTVNDSSLPLTSGNRITCFNNVNIGPGDTTVDITRYASTGDPELIFIKGSLVVDPGARFNATGNTSTSGAMIYRMFVSGNVNIATTGAGARATDFRALVTSSGTCSVGAPNASTAVWGAVVCNNFSATGVSSIYWDEQTAQITGDASEVRRIWSIVNYDNS